MKCCGVSWTIFIFITAVNSLDIPTSNVQRRGLDIVRIRKNGKDDYSWDAQNKIDKLSRVIRSYPEDDVDSSKRTDSKSKIWFGPRLGRSLKQNQNVDTFTWISLDDSPKLSDRKIHLLSMGKKFREGDVIIPRKLRSFSDPIDPDRNIGMWFGPRIGRSYFNNVNDDDVSIEDMDQSAYSNGNI